MSNSSFWGPVLGVARFELRRLRSSLIWLTGLLVVISALALYSGALHLRHQSTNANLIQVQEQEYQTKQIKRVAKRVKELKSKGKALSPDSKTFRNPANLAQHGTPAILPHGPLALVSIGLSPLQAQSTQVTLADPALLESQENLQHPLQLWTGHFDLAFVLVYLLPLLLIAISFDLTAGEQASGNLKMLLVQGGGLQSLILGKLAARKAVMLAMLGLLTAMAWTTSVALHQPFIWSRWGLIMLLSAAYGGLWLGLAALLNALRWRAANIAASLAAIWLLGVWVIPGSCQQLLQTLVPVPSRISFVQSFREATETARQESSKLLGKYMEDHPDLAAGGADNEYALLQLSKEQAIAQAIRPVVEGYQNQLERQQNVARWLTYLSPVTVFESAIMQLSGSGHERQQHYKTQVTGLHDQWQQHFMPAIQKNQSLLPEDFSRTPTFSYQELRISELSALLLSEGLFLALLAAGLLAYSLQRYRHYQVIESEPA